MYLTNLSVHVIKINIHNFVLLFNFSLKQDFDGFSRSKMEMDMITFTFHKF